MKRLSFLFIAFALVAFVSLNACKSSTEPAAEEATEEIVEESVAEEVADTAVADTAMMEEETPAEAAE